MIYFYFIYLCDLTFFQNSIQLFFSSTELQSIPPLKKARHSTFHNDFGYTLDESPHEDEVNCELSFLVENVGVTSPKVQDFMPYWN